MFGWLWECPLRGEKKLPLEKENLDLVLKSMLTWSPGICLKSENVNIESEAATGKKKWIFEILHLKIRKWIENELTTPYKTCLPPFRTTLLKSKIILTSKKPQNSNSLGNLSGEGGRGGGCTLCRLFQESCALRSVINCTCKSNFWLHVFST